MLINFITDKNNKKLLLEIEQLFNGFSIKYNTGNFQKNIVHYLDYKCTGANINVFYGYINNLLVNYSSNNIFVYDKKYFCQNWISQLNNYNLICIKSNEDKILDLKQEIHFIDFYNKDINIFYKSMLKLCKHIKSVKIPVINNYIEPEDLPYISVCIPTYNRRKFMKLVKLNYENSTYPKDKMELIILDDGIDKVEDAIPKDDNVRYYHNREKKNIGWKRNECVRLAKYDIIAFMDDDDYYYPNSLINRVCNLLKSERDCVFCSTIGCFHIAKLSSIINSTPIDAPLENKVSEASLTFKKSFWHNNKFNSDDKINEGAYFVKAAVEKCKEISWEGVFVQLLHTYNTIPKKLDFEERNGSHFNFSDEDFETIINL
tara:strand:+ start:738 stop:1859 length:1122 start_codon:yes stop_codon:yes gene_type:complete